MDAITVLTSIGVLWLFFRSFRIQSRDENQKVIERERAFGQWMGERQAFEKRAKEQFVEIHEAIDEMRRAIDEMRRAIDGIRKDVETLFERLPPPPNLIRDESPLKLARVGKEVAEEIQSRAWAEATAKAVIDQLDASTPYEVQEFAYAYVEGEEFNLAEDLVKAMKASAYEHGIRHWRNLKDVLAIELRDALLEALGMEPPK